MTRTDIRLLIAALSIVALMLVSPARGHAAATPVGDSRAFTPATFMAELGRIESALKSKHASVSDVAAIRATIPESWEIDTTQRHYTVSSKALTSLLKGAESDSAARQDKIDSARAWLSDVREQVEGYAARGDQSDSAAHAKLGQILARREFAGVGPPTEQDRLRKKINELILRFLTWLLGGLNRHPIATKAFFWLIVAACVAWLAFMLFRFWSRSAKLETMQKVESVAFDRPWQEWIRAARDAAARGDFREAIHCTYWAAIVRLESAGALTPDPTRTPRESLRMLGDSATTGVYSTTKQRDSLASLTSCLERVWYGQRAAAAGDFQDCLRQAEELGCRVS